MNTIPHPPASPAPSVDRLRPFNVQLPPKVRLALDKQAAAVGAVTANIWAGMVLSTVSELDAGTALKLMGKAKELRRNSRPRVSEL